MADIERDIESLKADIQKLGQDLARLTKTVGELTAETVRSRREQLSHAADSAVREAGKVVDETRAAVEAGIEERPFLSLLTAFCLGLIAGRLLSR